MTWLKPKAPAPTVTTEKAAEFAAPVASGAPPTLEALAREVDTGDMDGGKCPQCGETFRDGAKNCVKCGTRVRPDECAKCSARVEPGCFCDKCGLKAPEKPTAPIVRAPAQPGTVAAPTAPVEIMWNSANVRWFADAINMILIADECDPLDEEELELISKKAAPVANKYLKAGGQYADEINLGICVASLIFPKLWIKHVVLPVREEKKKAKEKAEAIKAVGG